jgi:hypothetical protein
MISMVRMFKQICWLALLALGVQRAAAYSFIVPFEAYQVPVIGYNIGGDLGGPGNLGEEYRRNTPRLYYSIDQNYLDFFGSNGVVEIDAAFAILNNLTNVSSYTSGLYEWPMEAKSINYKAQALSLIDMKSAMLVVMVEQLGLAEPDRFTWTLHDRLVGPGGCPVNVSYTVIKRNFDPAFSGLDVLQPTSYVNGTLYSYQIIEFCTGPDPLAEAVEFAVDPTADTFTAVASARATLNYGEFYHGLTRDDVGGLRYLLRTNNMNIEIAGDDTLTFITNTTPQLLFTSNLTQFVIQALTNDPGTLSALYPTLQIAASTPFFTNVVTTNVIFYFTNFPFDPVGTPAALVAVNQAVTNVATYYSHEFLNVFITPAYQLVSNTQIPLVPAHTATNRLMTIWTTNITSTACPPFTPYGSICTNISATTILTNGIFGDYYILPTNLCGVSIISTQLIAAITVTNVTLVATNAPGTTNAANEFFSQTPTYSFNQYIYAIRPVVCPSNSIALRQGIEQIQFERRDFDSLLNRFFYPITNEYTLISITNSTLYPQRIQRIVTTPDFLLTASDLATDPADGIIGASYYARSLTFSTNGALPNLNGPGVIQAGSVITFDKVGPIFGNFTPFNLDEASQVPILTWGSFNGSTNEPTIYPNGASILNLENQVLIQVSPNGPALPNGQLTVNYTNAFGGFTAVGGSPPYTWSLSPGSPGLPTGLGLNGTTGRIAGVPLAAGTYDFTIRMTDLGARFVDRPYSITITP